MYYLQITLTSEYGLSGSVLQTHKHTPTPADKLPHRNRRRAERIEVQTAV